MKSTDVWSETDKSQVEKEIAILILAGYVGPDSAHQTHSHRREPAVPKATSSDDCRSGVVTPPLQQ